MSEDFLLLNPGPVPLDDAVREAMSEPLVSHRSAEFEADFKRAIDGLRYIFEYSSIDGSQNASGGTPLLLMGTATLAMEAAIANLVGPDDNVVAIVNGKFGRRLRRIAEKYANVTALSYEWGASVDLDEIRDAIDDDTDVVTMVHNETSTGVLNPVAAVGDFAAAHDARYVVDGVTSIGGDAFYLDDWSVDIAITDAQKALAAPPGISAIYLASGVEAVLDASHAPFYADLPRHIEKVKQHQTPFTSAVPLVRAMAAAVEIIQDEGMPERIDRHRRQARAFRAGFDTLNLESFPHIEAPSNLSNTVTSIALPEPVKADPDAFFDAVATRNVSISGGQGHLGGQIFRVSNMGYLENAAVLRGIRTVAEALNEIGVEGDVEAAVSAAAVELDR